MSIALVEDLGGGAQRAAVGFLHTVRAADVVHTVLVGCRHGAARRLVPDVGVVERAVVGIAHLQSPFLRDFYGRKGGLRLRSDAGPQRFGRDGGGRRVVNFSFLALARHVCLLSLAREAAPALAQRPVTRTSPSQTTCRKTPCYDPP